MSGGTILDQAPAAPVAKPAPSPLVPLPASVEIAVLGGGAAGLACARHLARSGRDVHLFEAEPEVGGRMRTIIDRDRFHLDAGFHVLLTGYPAVRRDLDLASLRVRPFEPGAIVAARGHFHPLPDPFRNGGWLDALRFPFASMGDKMRFAGYRRRVASLSDEEIARSPDRSTREHLREIGLSDGFVDSFFVPFFGGVFLDPSLGASSRYFQSILRAFSNGDAGIPADGIGAVPRQIAAGIPPDRIHTAVRADSLIIEQERVCGFVAGERQVRAEKVVVACSPAESARLTGLAFPPLRALGVSVVYFAAPRPPTGEKRLFLRGDPEGWTNQFLSLIHI
ncbi:MAG: FAD-dependent oxidoreductase [Candidatus Eisenbacteria bacterium]|nr:FAD-dependent oxidoreductase [Candidatus Eisenbacteria bacterium]